MRFDRVSRQPFVGLVGAAAIGIVAADFVPVRPSQWFAFGTLFGVAILVAFLRPLMRSTYPVVAFGFFLLHSFQIEDTPGLRLAEKLGERPRTITASGSVIDEPKPTSNGFARFLFKLDSIEFGGTAVPTHAILMVKWRGNPELGDILKLFGTAGPIPPPRNPGEFDMRSYLARIDVRRALFVRYPENGTLLGHGNGNPILRAAQVSRAWMQQVLCRSLEDSPDVEDFLSGIVLGLRHQTPEDIEEPFQQTGTLHLFAVAGLHVGIVASLLWIVAAVAQLSRRMTAAFIIPVLLFYAAVTGLHVSSIRAALMSSILVGGLFFERKAVSLNSLSAAAFVLLAWNTNELFSTGFQLSFTVVGTIILMSESLSGFAVRFSAADPFLPRTLVRPGRRVLTAAFDWLCHGSSVSLAAWLGSILLMLRYFHLITPVSLLANLLVVPIAFFILAIALLSLLTAPLFGWVSIVFNNANWLLARVVLVLVHWFAQLPASHYYFAPEQLISHPRCRITVLDLGAGGALHLHTSGADWLFDCGSERDYDRILRPYLHVAGVNHLRGLLLSHGDSLHIGGAGPLLHDFSPEILIDNTMTDRSTVHRRLRRNFDEGGLRPLELTAGATFDVSPRIRAKILFPPQHLDADSADDEALVVQLEIPPAFKALIVSDSGYSTENALLASHADLRSDVLIKGQHHSGKSGGENFLSAVRPKLIVATSRDFPATERIADGWAEQARSRGIKLFRQDETGAVEIDVNERDWRGRAYVTGEIFRSESR